jgi:hypothetical protein
MSGYLWRGALLILIVFGGGCDRPPRFRVAAESNRVTVDCISGSPQLHEIVLSRGENPSVLKGIHAGVLSTVVPSGGPLTLGPNRDFELRVWGERGSLAVAHKFRFDE